MRLPLSCFGWEPADLAPGDTVRDGQLIVHIEGAHGRASDRGQSEDSNTCRVPLEMIVPALGSRIEQRHQSFGLGVAKVSPIALECVARPTTLPQVVTDGEAATRRRQKVVNKKPLGHQSLRHLAIPALIARIGGNQFSQGLADICSRDSITLLAAEAREWPEPSGFRAAEIVD